MTDTQSGASSRASKAGGLLALAAGAALAVTAFTGQHEGLRYHAYQDSKGVWTICNGHTAGVGPNSTATPEQCQGWLREELTGHMVASLRSVPELAENMSALKASGDFAYNAGDTAFAQSPMAAAFHQRAWRKGCEAFAGYWAGVRVTKPIPGAICKPLKSGGFICQLKGLLARRQHERDLCLS